MANSNAQKRPARRVTLDLTGPEWDWLAQQAIEIGIPFATMVRHTLNLAAPIGNDKARFDAMKRALFEARLAMFGWMKHTIHASLDAFCANPEAHIPFWHRGPTPETLASHPAWEEPTDPSGTGRGGGNFP